MLKISVFHYYNENHKGNQKMTYLIHRLDKICYKNLCCLQIKIIKSLRFQKKLHIIYLCKMIQEKCLFAKLLWIFLFII